MPKSQVTRWGNSLAVRIPKAIAEEAGLSEGDAVELETPKKGVVSVKKPVTKPRLRDLVAGITLENRHVETPWGKRKGNEEW